MKRRRTNPLEREVNQLRFEVAHYQRLLYEQLQTNKQTAAELERQDRENDKMALAFVEMNKRVDALLERLPAKRVRKPKPGAMSRKRRTRR